MVALAFPDRLAPTSTNPSKGKAAIPWLVCSAHLQAHFAGKKVHLSSKVEHGSYHFGSVNALYQAATSPECLALSLEVGYRGCLQKLQMLAECRLPELYHDPLPAAAVFSSASGIWRDHNAKDFCRWSWHPGEAAR